MYRYGTSHLGYSLISIKRVSRQPVIPPFLRRSLAVLIIFLMGISVARLLVEMHKQDERISILEAQIDQLLADTTRLQIIPYAQNYTHYPAYHETTSHRHTHRDNRNSQSATSPSPSSSTTASGRVSERDSITAQPVAESHKFTTPHLFDLNTIDSLTLIRIPGIAARTASTILRQRQRYGGFYSPEQLRDFMTWSAAQDYLDEWCTQWFTADANRLLAIPVNRANIGQLQRHPYIDHDQATEMVRYRTRHRQIASAAELQQLSSFTSEQLDRLLPYLSFE